MTRTFKNLVAPVCVLAIATVLLLIAPAIATATFEPTTWVYSGHIGQSGHESTEPGGFDYPESVAGAPNGDVYVADKINRRIQEFEPDGKFVLMFGWNVNKTRIKEAAPQTQRNVCMATEVGKGAECGAGEPGTGLAEQLYGIQDVAVDQATGDVYVLDVRYNRVDEYTADGTFVLMIGRRVNETKVKTVEAKGDTPTEAEVEEENLCTVKSGDVCQAGEDSEKASTEPGAFKPLENLGNLLAVGGPHDLLYVGDQDRVQRFETEGGKENGKYAGEIALTTLNTGPEGGSVDALAVSAAGTVYVAYQNGNEAYSQMFVHEYSAAGSPFAEFEIEEHKGGEDVSALALDNYGRLGILEFEVAPPREKHGFLYTASGKGFSEFDPSAGFLGGGTGGLAFAPGTDDLYVVEEESQEIQIYKPVTFPEAVTCPVENVLATTVTLCGEIDPNGLQTLGSFKYGTSAAQLDSTTPTVFEGAGHSLEGVHTTLSGLLPNETYYFETAVQAEVNGAPEHGSGQILSFHTKTPPPQVAQPEASFVAFQSATLSALLNPEHAGTSYDFEYGPCETLAGCGEVHITSGQEASWYGLRGVGAEIVGLRPQTTYSFRLLADNQFDEGLLSEGGRVEGDEGHFTTGALPVPQASTGSPSAVGVTSAVVSGTVNPDGRPAAYRFELGVYAGTETDYGVLFSGSAGLGTTPVDASYAVSGLQPGTTYAYRIVLESGYGTSYGAPVTLTTAGLPSVLASPTPLAMLSVPNIPFPKAAKATAKALTNAQKLTVALKACAKETKRRRAACERQARKRYDAKSGKSKQKHK